MIAVTRLNDTVLYVNADLIMTVEATPDTVLTLMNGEKWVLKDSPETIVDRVVAYKRRFHLGES